MADVTEPTKPPLVAHLHACRVRYSGRASAKQTGGSLLVIVKGDGSVILHDPAAGVKPHFYNPAGKARTWQRGGRLHVEAESTTGEALKVSGRVGALTLLRPDEPAARAPRRRVEGTERDLVQWIREHTSDLGILQAESGREERRVGGRVDLRFGDLVVEAKRRGDVVAFDQAQRYLRDKDIRRVAIVCATASGTLRDLCDRTRKVDLIELGEEVGL